MRTLYRVKSTQFVNILVLIVVLGFAALLFVNKYTIDLMEPFFHRGAR